MSKILRTRIDPKERHILIWATVASVLIFLTSFAWIYGPVTIAYWTYQPHEGDILFQSLPKSILAKVMEGATDSPYSHCGIVTKIDGKWMVCEAYQKVTSTPLSEVIFRGKNYGFAIYRFKPDKQTLIDQTIRNVKEQFDKPYDVRFSMNNDEIYASELIYKAYRQASGGESLGKLVSLGQLRWEPYEETIRYFERGPVPLSREIITPRNLAEAEQLDLVFFHRIDTRPASAKMADAKTFTIEPSSGD
jgi:hypothetical protein